MDKSFLIECNFILLYFIPMEKLEELLNSLIEKWWKPRGKYEMEYQYMLWWKEHWFYDLYFIRWHYPVRVPIKHSLRELVSKESWLWQFVCENGMVYKYSSDWETDEWECSYNCDGYEKDDYYKLHRTDYEFYLVESALKDESELEDFLLSNIKVDVESK